MKDGPLAEQIIKAFDTMPAQLQTAGRYVLDHSRDVALLSMREQARQAAVQPATMTRLAKHLGFDGYDQIREIYAAAIRGGGLGFSSKAEAQVASQKLKGDKALAADMLDAIARQIGELSAPENLDRLTAAARRLADARRIYCLGFRSSHSIAWHINYILTLIGEQVHLIDGLAATGSDILTGATREDVLIVASVHPYTRLTVELAEYAARRDIPIIAITDSEVAPLAQMADYTLVVSTESPSFFHAMSPAFVVAEILGAIVAGRKGGGALKALHHLDEHLAALNTHFKPRQTNRS